MLSLLIRAYLAKKIHEYQTVIDRYRAFPPKNINEVELATRECIWREYAISGMKKAWHDCTPNVLEKMFTPYTPVEVEGLHDTL